MIMEMKRLYKVYFSATGITKQLCDKLAERLRSRLALPIDDIPTVDFTLPSARVEHYDFGPGDLVVFGCPTYAGKLPNKILPFIKEGFSGNGAAAIALVSFGNRAFDDALAELSVCLSNNGFVTIGAGAFVGRHAFTDKLAFGRPDAADLAELDRFAGAVTGKLAAAETLVPVTGISGDAGAPYYTPRGLDGEPVMFLKAKPVTDLEKCDACGLCAKLCPMGSIDSADPAKVNGICIKCHACVRGCPKGAKAFEDADFLSHRAMLEQQYTRRAEPVWLV